MSGEVFWFLVSLVLLMLGMGSGFLVLRCIDRDRVFWFGLGVAFTCLGSAIAVFFAVLLEWLP